MLEGILYHPCLLRLQSFWICKNLMAAVLGGMATLSLPPLGWVPALLPAFSGLLWLTSQENRGKELFKQGWWFGFGYFFTSLYWVGHAFSITGVGYLAPIAVCALCGYLALFPALALSLSSYFSAVPVSRVLAFSGFWVLGEWVRGHVILNGFPWSLIGYAWDLPLLQSTAVIGIYGLSLLTVLSAAILASYHKGWILAVWGMLLAGWLAGYYYLTVVGETEFTSTYVRLVQPCIPQAQKWLPQHLSHHLECHLRLSAAPSAHPLQAIIWGEASVPSSLLSDPVVKQELMSVVPKDGVLIFGSPRWEKKAQSWSVWNSLFALNEQGVVAATYDKSRLVPFGEYFPFRQFLTIPKLTHGNIDYSAGSGPCTLSVSPLPPFSPLICYEAIFPGSVVTANPPPEWLLNITNDAWYGRSAGPYQHLAIVRVRAIEEGLPLVRVANNGISVVVDSHGRIIHQLDLDEVGMMDFFVPKGLPFAINGVYLRKGLFWVALIGLFLCCMILTKKRVSSPPTTLH